jgi:hypothetical protein
MAPRISVKATAQELAQRILGGKTDIGFRWQEDGSVQVLVSEVFPAGSGYKLTVEGRRKRLCDYIGDTLVRQGWRKIGWNRFTRSPRPATADETAPVPLL